MGWRVMGRGWCVCVTYPDATQWFRIAVALRNQCDYCGRTDIRVGAGMATSELYVCITARARSGNCRLFLSLESVYNMLSLDQYEYGTK